MKPKRTQPKTPDKLQERDFFQTPNYAKDLIVTYLPVGVVWECACGHGKIINRLRDRGFEVFGTDLQTGQSFFEYIPDRLFDVICTNVPFSLKREFYEQALEFGKPFAFLMPVDFCGWILRAMQDERAQWLIPTRRIDYITPTGKQGKDSAAQYHSDWFCYGLNLPRQITIVELTKQVKENI